MLSLYRGLLQIQTKGRDYNMETEIITRKIKTDSVMGGWKVVVKYSGPKGTTTYYCPNKAEARALARELHKQVNG